MDALAALRGERTIIAVAHRLTTVQACDRVVLVDDGHLVDVAPFAVDDRLHPRDGLSGRSGR
jgi:ATP-binding cassette, subfamily B, bacterial PglK